MGRSDSNTSLPSGSVVTVTENQRIHLEEAMDFIRAHCLEVPNLVQVAAKSGLSRFHFLRLFHQHFGKTVKHAVTECQVEEAKKMLLEGIDTAEVARRTGFANQSHFTTRFKLITGTTPAVWRREQGENKPLAVDLRRQENALESPHPPANERQFNISPEVERILQEARALREASEQLTRRAAQLARTIEEQGRRREP